MKVIIFHSNMSFIPIKSSYFVNSTAAQDFCTINFASWDWSHHRRKEAATSFDFSFSFNRSCSNLIL